MASHHLPYYCWIYNQQNHRLIIITCLITTFTSVLLVLVYILNLNVCCNWCQDFFFFFYLVNKIQQQEEKQWAFHCNIGGLFFVLLLCLSCHGITAQQGRDWQPLQQPTAQVQHRRSPSSMYLSGPIRNLTPSPGNGGCFRAFERIGHSGKLHTSRPDISYIMCVS